MDEEVERYNKIYTDNPEKWAGEPGGLRDLIAYSNLHKYFHEPETVLDIGCGNGHTIEKFMRIWPNTLFYGIDISEVAIELAKERVPEAEFMVGDFKDYTLNCDLVLVMGVAEHFEKLVDGLRSLRKYGTLFYLEVPDCLRAGIFNGSDNYDEGFRETYKGGLQVEWHLKKRSWEERIRMAGFEILEKPAGPDAITFVWILR
jgi:SAM-dependent methyltransferase